jgi:hypothetical protein
MIKQHFNENIVKSIDTELKNIILSNKNINNLESKIENIETNYKSLINNIKQQYENLNNLNYKNQTSLELLQKEKDIIKILLKYSLQNNLLEIKFIKICLKFILYLSENLQNRLNQKNIILTSETNKNNLTRCSYKFCNFKDKCNFYYKEKSKCYQDHFVHNMVCLDIKVLLTFIDNNYKNMDTLIQTKESKDILKSLNTLSYVINHMENELKLKCIYLDKNEWDNFH